MQLMTKVFGLFILANLMACPSSHAGDGAADGSGGTDARPPRSDGGLDTTAAVDACGDPESRSKLDLLLVIDNSGTMGPKQEILRTQLPNLVRILTTGDRNGDGTGDFAPVRELNVGVISTDMGVGNPDSHLCQNASMWGDDGVLAPERERALPGCSVSPPYLSFLTGDPEQFAMEVGCASSLGRTGCGFEQPLEAALKAITPSMSPTRFAGGTSGHADGENAGFLRDDALLAIVVLTDEGDCSAQDLALFDPANPRYDGSINLRCTDHDGGEDGLLGRGALHPLARYADGFIDAKGGAENVVFISITGIPPGTESLSHGALLDRPDMQVAFDSACDGPIDSRPTGCPRLRTSCASPDTGSAFPPRRMVRTAQLLEARGVSTGFVSICQDDYSGVVDPIVRGLSSPCSP